MPELPEVETIKMQLEQTIKGLRITDVEVLTKKSFLGEPEEIIGKKVIGVKRRAKITIIELENDICLAIHLKLTGQLIYRENQKSKIPPAKAWHWRAGKNQNENLKFKINEKDSQFSVSQLPNKYTRVIISFNNGGKLYFNDLRIFGWVRIMRNLRDLDVEKYGPEANDENSFTLAYFKKLLAVSHKPIKLVIMDQEKLAGVGNIYANEAIFMAGILPSRPGNSLMEAEIEKLRNSIIRLLNEAIRHKGTSDNDEAYRQITGEKGTHQNYLQVYGQAGKKCPKCGRIIKRIALGGRGTFYCEYCQK